MPKTLIVRGRYTGGRFVAEEPLPDTEGKAQLIITAEPDGEPHSVFRSVGSATTLRSRDEILSQLEVERDSWGDR